MNKQPMKPIIRSNKKMGNVDEEKSDVRLLRDSREPTDTIFDVRTSADRPTVSALYQ